MQTEFGGHLGKLCLCMNKSVTDMVDLNLSTLNKLTKNTSSFEKLFQTKKPEDILSTQMELLNNASVEATQYIQKACAIGLEGITEANKVWTDIMRDTATKASDVMQQGKVKAKVRE